MADMAKVKYNVKGVEGGSDYDTPVPVGLYTAKISECLETESKSSGNPMLAITLEIVHGEWKGRNLWDYIVLNDASAWKLRQLIDALGLKDSGTLDTNKITGERVQVRVKHETDDEYGTRAKVGSLIAMPEDADPDDEDPDDDDDDDDDDDEESYEDWSLSDLKAEAKDRSLKSSGPKSALIERLEADDEDDDDDDGDEPF